MPSSARPATMIWLYRVFPLTVQTSKTDPGLEKDSSVDWKHPSTSGSSPAVIRNDSVVPQEEGLAGAGVEGETGETGSGVGSGAGVKGVNGAGVGSRVAAVIRAGVGAEEASAVEVQLQLALTPSNPEKSSST